MEASIFDRGIHTLAVVTVCHFICVIFVALLPLEVVFLFLATLVDFSFSIPTVMILAYLFITEGLPLSLTSDIRD